MKYFLLLILAMCFLESKAQSQRQTTGDTIIHEVGYELYKYHRKKTTGTILLMAGGLFLGIGLNNNGSGQNAGFQIIGTGMTLVGGLMSITASTHIGNAGILMMSLSGLKKDNKKQNQRRNGRKNH